MDGGKEKRAKQKAMHRKIPAGHCGGTFSPATSFRKIPCERHIRQADNARLSQPGGLSSHLTWQRHESIDCLRRRVCNADQAWQGHASKPMENISDSNLSLCVRLQLLSPVPAFGRKATHLWCCIPDAHTKTLAMPFVDYSAYLAESVCDTQTALEWKCEHLCGENSPALTLASEAVHS